MTSVNAIILNKKPLNYEILFKKISSYIEIALKSSDISNIIYADDFDSIDSEKQNCDYLLFIDSVVPEIVEYDSLVDFHIKNKNDISYFMTDAHSHTDGIIYDKENKPCGFGLTESGAKLDIFIVSKKSFCKEILENPFNYKLGFFNVAESTVVENPADVLTLTEDFRETINYSHLNNEVFIMDMNTTYISSGIEIGENTQILPNTIIRGNTKIGANCILGPNTVIENMQIGDNVKINSSQAFDSIIDDNTTVGPFAYIRPESNIGKNVKIGDFVEIKKSTLGEGTKVSHLTYIGDATVGKNVNFGCGSVVVNYDGYNKYQTVVEDNAFIGCNTNLVSPVRVEKGAFTAAGSTITSDVLENSLAVARTKQKNIPDWASKFRSLKEKTK